MVRSQAAFRRWGVSSRASKLQVMETKSEIERFILDDLLSDSRESLNPDEPLYGSGILDSLGTLRLITFLEERFGMQIEDGEVGDENFRSLNTIHAFVERKRAGTKP
jgi:acyl carrier protein